MGRDFWSERCTSGAASPTLRMYVRSRDWQYLKQCKRAHFLPRLVPKPIFLARLRRWSA